MIDYSTQLSASLEELTKLFVEYFDHMQSASEYKDSLMDPYSFKRAKRALQTRMVLKYANISYPDKNFLDYNFSRGLRIPISS